MPDKSTAAQENHHPVVSVKPGQDRIDLFTTEDWTAAYNKLIPTASILLAERGYLSFHDAHDVLNHGFYRFLTMSNPEIRPSKGCYWHYKHHVKYAYLDEVTNFAKQSKRQEDASILLDNHNFKTNNTPTEHMTRQERTRKVNQLIEKIDSCSGRKEDMKAVLNSLLYDDVGTNSSSISNKKLASSSGLNISRTVAAKRRLKRQGESCE